jgi:hypothetical protein
MKELRDVYRSQSYKAGEALALLAICFFTWNVVSLLLCFPFGE